MRIAKFEEIYNSYTNYNNNSMINLYPHSLEVIIFKEIPYEFTADTSYNLKCHCFNLVGED